MRKRMRVANGIVHAVVTCFLLVIVPVTTTFVFVPEMTPEHGSAVLLAEAVIGLMAFAFSLGDASRRWKARWGMTCLDVTIEPTTEQCFEPVSVTLRQAGPNADEALLAAVYSLIEDLVGPVLSARLRIHEVEDLLAAVRNKTGWRRSAKANPDLFDPQGNSVAKARMEIRRPRKYRRQRNVR